jgi:putative hydrolase of the HAD superfamily
VWHSSRRCGAEASVLPGPGIAAVVLDFDGLIVDTETPIFEAWRAAYQRRGCSIGLDEWQHALGTHGGFDPLAHLEALLGQSLDREAVQRG